MNITPQLQKQKDEEFKVFLKEVKAYLKENPNHTGSIAKTNAIGAKLYRFAYIRQGKITSSVYTEKHFQVLDKMLPDWDNYGISRFDFDKFAKNLQQFVDERNQMYDQMGVPVELRDLHVPEKQMIGTYYLGNRTRKIKMGLTTLTAEQTKIAEKICPGLFKSPLKFSIATFYVHLKKFVEEKDKEYDKLGVPKSLRDYRVHLNDMVGDYPIGARKRYFLSNWQNLSDAQKQCFLKLAPNFFEERKKGFDFNKFFMNYANFIAKKNQYYDKLETPKELRTYSLHTREEIDGEPIGDKLYYIKKHYALSLKEASALNELNPDWRKPPVKFDFGEFYGQLLQFRKKRNAEYDKLGVPQERRAYTVFSSTYMGNYKLGINLYLIRTGKIKISKTEKEYLLKLDPTCFSAPNVNKLKTQKPSKTKTSEQERV